MAGGVALLAGGLILLIDPGAASWMWPWRISSITARAFGAWLVGFGVAMVQIAWEADCRRVRPATSGAGVLGVLQLIAVLRYHDVPDWGALQTRVFAVVQVGFVALGLWAWQVAHRSADATAA